MKIIEKNEIEKKIDELEKKDLQLSFIDLAFGFTIGTLLIASATFDYFQVNFNSINFLFLILSPIIPNAIGYFFYINSNDYKNKTKLLKELEGLREKADKLKCCDNYEIFFKELMELKDDERLIHIDEDIISRVLQIKKNKEDEKIAHNKNKELLEEFISVDSESKAENITIENQ